eukprot:389165-Prymnesium_polylepis.2
MRVGSCSWSTCNTSERERERSSRRSSRQIAALPPVRRHAHRVVGRALVAHLGRPQRCRALRVRGPPVRGLARLAHKEARKVGHRVDCGGAVHARRVDALESLPGLIPLEGILLSVKLSAVEGQIAALHQRDERRPAADRVGREDAPEGAHRRVEPRLVREHRIVMQVERDCLRRQRLEHGGRSCAEHAAFRDLVGQIEREGDTLGGFARAVHHARQHRTAGVLRQLLEPLASPPHGEVAGLTRHLQQLGGRFPVAVCVEPAVAAGDEQAGELRERGGKIRLGGIPRHQRHARAGTLQPLDVTGDGIRAAR